MKKDHPILLKSPTLGLFPSTNQSMCVIHSTVQILERKTVMFNWSICQIQFQTYLLGTDKYILIKCLNKYLIKLFNNFLKKTIASTHFCAFLLWQNKAIAYMLIKCCLDIKRLLLAMHYKLFLKLLSNHIMTRYLF